MKTFEVKTGHGYFKRISTNIIYCKAQLPKGKHPLQDDFEYVEVDNKVELDKIVADVTESEDVIWRRKMQNEILLMAEERLQAKGEKKPKTLKEKV